MNKWFDKCVIWFHCRQNENPHGLDRNEYLECVHHSFLNSWDQFTQRLYVAMSLFIVYYIQSSKKFSNGRHYSFIFLYLTHKCHFVFCVMCLPTDRLFGRVVLYVYAMLTCFRAYAPFFLCLRTVWYLGAIWITNIVFS